MTKHVLILLLAARAFGQSFTHNDLPWVAQQRTPVFNPCAGAPQPTLLIKVLASTGVLNTSGSPAANGDPVKTWTDQSGNGYNLTQLGGAGVCPTYVSTGGASNNSPWVNFTGSGVMCLSNLTATASQTNTYVWVWIDPNGGVGGATRWLMDSGTGTGNRVYYVHNLSWHLNAGTDFAVGFPWDPNNGSPIVRYNITAMTFAGTNTSIMQDGIVVTGPGDAGTNNQPGVVIGNGFNGTVPATLGLVEWRWYTGAAFCSNDLFNVCYVLATNYNLTGLPGLH